MCAKWKIDVEITKVEYCKIITMPKIQVYWVQSLEYIIYILLMYE